MKTSLLEYYKLIISKVSFDPQLILKEYQKALRVLNGSESAELRRWCLAQNLLA